jgi:hypothetical protein
MGKILRVKYGYNPNSSSIGTHVSAFVYGAACVALAVNGIAAAIAARKNGKKSEKRPDADNSSKQP